MQTIVDRRFLVQAGLPDRLASLCRRVSAAIGDWSEQERQRRAFNRLDDRLLADIGLTRDHQVWEYPQRRWLL
jgi:uncharacterized protein YjiS (DUF1127 family)